jgi:site-specific DNA-methyltransferase (adenine-specific)
MRPYFQRDGATIYHGDCRGILPTLQVDTICADPPFGINLEARRGGNRSKLAAALNDYRIFGDDEPFDPAHLLGFRRVILWGGNHFASRLPDTRCWLLWDKRKGGKSDDQADAEIAWTNFDEPTRLYSHLWRGMIKDSEKDERRITPTQKPVSLMRWCLTVAKPLGVVCDPYMGSGSTLRAALDMGFPCVGIDVEERLCEAAARRLEQMTLLEVA